jgi:enoyl-CoA hydratase
MGPTRMILPKPVIAAVEGYAVAGGLELALWCDLRVAAGDAVFGVFSRRFGVPLVDLGTIRLPRLVGHGVAMDLILTGRPVHAIEAKQIGLVSRLAPSGHALAVALELANQLASFPQEGLRNDRLSAISQWGLPYDEAMKNERRYGVATVRSGETLGGAARFSRGEGRHGSF